MALTNAFYEAVKSENVRRVRIMMKDSLLVDPTFGEFAEMEKEAASLKDLYDEYDGKPLEEDKEKWTNEYMDTQMVKLIGNFSHKRVEHLKKVVRHLKPIKTTAADKNTQRTQTRRQSSSSQDSSTKVVIGAVVGAVAGGVVAHAVSVTAAAGVALGAVAGGAAVLLLSEGE